MAPTPRPVRTRLIEKLMIAENGCWEWTGAKDRDGYGVMGIGRDRQFRVHRVAFKEFSGVDPEGFMVLHRCDNPKCFNPNHLFLGTAKDNTADMFEKGREHRSKGEDHPNSKVSALDVAEMKRLRSCGEKLTSLAERFGISFQNVSSICRGVTWNR